MESHAVLAMRTRADVTYEFTREKIKEIISKIKQAKGMGRERLISMK